MNQIVEMAILLLANILVEYVSAKTAHKRMDVMEQKLAIIAKRQYSILIGKGLRS